MITDSYSMRSMLQSNNNSNEELGFLLQKRQQEMMSERERELSMYRTGAGSAPPTVEGSLSAVGGLFGSGVLEEKMRADPAYVSYYYANVNLNPRLPPPLVSKEDWRFAQRSSAAIGDRRRMVDRDDGGSNGSRSFSTEKGQVGSNGGEWGGDGLIGLPGLGLGSRQKSIAEMIQDDVTHAKSASRYPSRPTSRNAFDDSVELELRTGANIQGLSGAHNVGSSASQSYAAALGASLSRSTTPDPQLVARAPSPRIPPAGAGRGSSLDKRKVNGSNSFNGVSPGMSDSADLVSALSGMTLSTDNLVDEENHIKQHPYLKRSESGPLHLRSIPQSAQGSYGSGPGVDLNNSYLKGLSPPMLNNGVSSPSQYHNVNSPNSSFSNYGLNGYTINPASPSMLGNQLGSGNLPPLFENAMGGLGLGPNLIATAAELQTRQVSLVDPLQLQFLRSNEYAAAQMERDSMNNYMDFLELQKAYLGMLSPQKSQYGLPYLGKSASLSNNNGYYGSPNFDLGMSYPGSPLAGGLLPNSPFGSGSPIRHGDRSLRYPSGMRNLAGGVMGTFDESFGSSLLDEFKNNKTKCFELSEISGHVVEFSADQYGSRFIQQKLETATLEEKNMVYKEVMPQVLSLMTDVFGNYVIQKFFEHGTASQIRDMADQLIGHVLTLSLQMYGCRVIQKAIEVVDLDQKTKMVAELDGHVMRCVRDQNGNHVIQKCIERIPEDAIHFIISTFYDQVVSLSTHPYGCRVIQRILEHCSDPKTLKIVMDEIMRSVCMLAQDQYGNYVIQHVLEHGKPDERTCIINKLIGQIVQMSQQKFASNVVEKCLTFGTPEERQNLVNEMLGSTDENEPLQAMMKDQFANYVVQKVLETCDDQQLELILNRIKVHLNALKKYTYGKHIVARVEKLVAAGERRIGALASLAAAAAAT